MGYGTDRSHAPAADPPGSPWGGEGDREATFAFPSSVATSRTRICSRLDAVFVVSTAKR